MHLSPSRQTFLNASVLDIVTDDKDGILFILLEQWSLILMPSVPKFVGALHQGCRHWEKRQKGKQTIWGGEGWRWMILAEKEEWREKSIRNREGKSYPGVGNGKAVFRGVHGKDLGCKAMIPWILDRMHSTKDYKIKLSKDDENLFFFFHFSVEHRWKTCLLSFIARKDHCFQIKQPPLVTE